MAEELLFSCNNIVKNQVLGACKVVKLTWTVENFSTLNVTKVYSEIFTVGGFKWRVYLYPKGYGVDYLSLHIEVYDAASLPNGWFAYADIVFTVVNQIDAKLSVTHETKNRFKYSYTTWGYSSFMLLSKLHGPGKGFLVDNKCKIEIEVSVSAASQVPTNEDQASGSYFPRELSESDSLYGNPNDSICIKARSFLRLTSKRPLSSIYDSDNVLSPTQEDASLVEKHFDKLILLPLNVLANPEKENVMKESLSLLGNDLSMYTEEQTKRIKKLKIDFPTMVQEWRESVEVQVSGLNMLSKFEKTRSLLEDSVKAEEGIKAKLDEVNTRVSEVALELKRILNERKRLLDKKREASRNTRLHYALAEGEAKKIEDKDVDMIEAKETLEDIKDEWDSIVSHFT